MSAAFTPPDSMSPDDIRTVADVRRAVWINGIIGFFSGATTGTVGHLVLQTLQKKYVGDTGTPATASWIYKCLRPLPPLGKNTFMLSLLGGASLGSFVLSTTAGKNVVHLLHPIFKLGREEHAGKSPYQIAMSKAQQPEEMIDSKTTNSAEYFGNELDAAHHRARSLRRKLSMKHRLESGQSLSSTGSRASTNSNEFEETEEI